MIQTLQWSNSNLSVSSSCSMSKKKKKCSGSIPHQFMELMKIASAKLIYINKIK